MRSRLCAVVRGADTWEEVELFGEARHAWLEAFLALPNGTPSHDKFYRVFASGPRGLLGELRPVESHDKFYRVFASGGVDPASCND